MWGTAGDGAGGRRWVAELVVVAIVHGVVRSGGDEVGTINPIMSGQYVF